MVPSPLIAPLPVTTSSVSCVMEKLALPTTKSNTFSAALPSICSCTDLVSLLLNAGIKLLGSLVELVALNQSTRSPLSSPTASKALLINTEPLAQKSKPLIPCSWAPAKEISSPR